MRTAGYVVIAGLALLIAGTVQAVVLLDDDFTGASLSPPDAAKWTTSPNPTGGGSFARVVQSLSTDLAVLALTDGHTGWAQSLQAFGPGSSVSIYTDNNAGPTEGVMMGFMSDTRANSGVFTTPSLVIATTATSTATVYVFGPAGLITSADTGISITANQEFRIDWISDSAARFAIDNDRNGTWDYDHTFTVAAGSLSATLPVQLWQQVQGMANLTVDRVTVSASTPPLFYDHFNVANWSTWNRSSTGGLVSVNSNNSSLLVVNGSGGAQWAQSVPTFEPGTRVEWMEIHYGNNAFMGLSDTTSQAAIVRTDQSGNYWFNIYDAAHGQNTMVDLGTAQPTFGSGQAVHFVLEWTTYGAMRLKIDVGNDGSFECDRYFATQLTGPIPLYFYNQPQQSVLAIDWVKVDTLPYEPVTFFDGFDFSEAWGDKWTRSDPNPAGQDVSINRDNNGLLVVNGSNGPQWAKSVTSINSGTRVEWVENHYGYSAFMGLDDTISQAAMIRTDQSSNYWFHIYDGAVTPVQNDLTDLGVPMPATSSGVAVHFVLEWATVGSIRVMIDVGNNGSFECDRTFTTALAGPIPFYFYNQTNPSVLGIDWVKAAGMSGSTTATPVISPGTGTYDNPQTVTITCATSDAQIYYTLDGSTPTQASTLYTEAITVDHKMTVRAKAWSASLDPSATTGATFTFSINRPFNIPYISHINVDGDLTKAAWADVAWAPLDTPLDRDPMLYDFAEGYYKAKWGDNGTKLYVAMKVRDTSHVLFNSYGTGSDWWNRDAAEIYVHTTGTGPAAYWGSFVDAQQYAMGVMNSNRNAVWTAMGDASAVPAGAGFTAAGREDGQWLYYEVALTPYQTFSMNNPSAWVVSPLRSGDVIGLDVAAVCNDIGGTNGDGYTGEQGENDMTGKFNDYTKIGKHRLVRTYTSDDLAAVLAAMDSQPGSGNWNAGVDFDRDNEITSSDLSLVLANLP